MCERGFRREFFQRECRPILVARRVIDVEASGFVVRHRAEFARTLPFQPPSLAAVFAVALERLQIRVDLRDRLLGGMGRDLRKGWPLAFPAGEFVDLVELTRTVIVVRTIVLADGVITNLPVDIDVSPRFACGLGVGIRTEPKRVIHRYVALFGHYRDKPSPRMVKVNGVFVEQAHAIQP